jgi:hypothetical protein
MKRKKAEYMKYENKVTVYLPSLMMKVPEHLYALGDTNACHTLKSTTSTHKNEMHSSNTCDMYMCRSRHINDPVLSSLKMEGIRLFSENVIKNRTCNVWASVL